jgi:hypothetical protein
LAEIRGFRWTFSHYLSKNADSITDQSLKLIENAARRAAGMLLIAPDVSETKDQMIAKEIQEMRDSLQAFQTAIETGEVAGLKNGPTRLHQGPECTRHTKSRFASVAVLA